MELRAEGQGGYNHSRIIHNNIHLLKLPLNLRHHKLLLLTATTPPQLLSPKLLKPNSTSNITKPGTTKPLQLLLPLYPVFDTVPSLPAVPIRLLDQLPEGPTHLVVLVAPAVDVDALEAALDEDAEGDHELELLGDYLLFEAEFAFAIIAIQMAFLSQ